jgi:hypothetical protein
MTDLTEDDLPDHNQDLRDALDPKRKRKTLAELDDTFDDDELDSLD